MTYKHYIRTREDGAVVDGWSTGPFPDRDPEGAVCITDQGGYQFRLRPTGEENPALMTMDGVPLYQYTDGAVADRPPADVQREQAEIAAAHADEQARVHAVLARREAVAEVQAALAMAQINTLDVDDATALRWQALYPAWTAGVDYAAGEHVQRGDKLYRCRQGHMAQADWTPERTPALWEEICERHAGTADDPIPYSGNMALTAGKYYTQDGVTYRCTRDTGEPVYHPLAALAGLYVEVAA